MKRILCILGLTAAAAATLTNCTKVSPVDEPSGLFTIRVSSDVTRTTNDGMQTLWAEGDALSLLYAPAGTNPDSEFTNVKMTLSSGAGTASAEFTGTASVSGSNDFYAVYPYSSKLKKPGEQTDCYIYVGNKNGVTQNGYDSMAHLSGNNCPLYGVVLANDSGTVPSFSMKQLASVMELDVVSSCSESFVLTKVAVEASEDIVGSYYINVAGDSPVYTLSGSNYVSSTGTVEITGGTAVTKGSTVKVFLPVKPFTQAAGTPLHVTLYATVGGFAKSAKIDITPAADAAKRTFSAGKIKKVNVQVSAFSGPGTVPVSSLTAGTEAAVSGEVAALSTNGFVLADGTGAVFVYKTVKDMTVGQTVSVSGTPTEYSMGLQFPNTCTVTPGASGTFSYPSATTLDAAAISAFVGRTSAALAQYVTFTGDVSGTRDFIVGDGDAANATGYYLTDDMAALIEACCNVTIKGYACFVQSGKCSVVVTKVVQNVIKPVIPEEIVFPQGGHWSGTTNYPLASYSIQNLGDWKVSVTCDGTVITSASWYWDPNSASYLRYSISTNQGGVRQGWLKVTATKGKYAVEQTYYYTQNANPNSSEKTYTWTAEGGQVTKEAGTVTVSDVEWSFPAAGYVGFDAEKGIQIGSKNNPQTTAWTLSTSGISGTVKSVKVNACTAASGVATLSISVGGTSYLSGQSLTTTSTPYTGTGSSSGEIAITLQAEQRAMYIKSIEIVYE